jgi:hypothetical protein
MQRRDAPPLRTRRVADAPPRRAAAPRAQDEAEVKKAAEVRTRSRSRLSRPVRRCRRWQRRTAHAPQLAPPRRASATQRRQRALWGSAAFGGVHVQGLGRAALMRLCARLAQADEGKAGGKKGAKAKGGKGKRGEDGSDEVRAAAAGGGLGRKSSSPATSVEP